jgi:hypothetical protein
MTHSTGTGSFLALAAIAALALTLGGCPQAATSNVDSQSETATGADAAPSGGLVGALPPLFGGPELLGNVGVGGPANPTGTGFDFDTSDDSSDGDVKDEDAFKLLAEPLEPDASLFAAGAAPTFNAAEQARLAAALAVPPVTENSILADVSVPDATSQNGLIAAVGRLAAILTAAGPTPDHPDQAGVFAGAWVQRDGAPLGTISGWYSQAAPSSPPPGFVEVGQFQGQYFDAAGVLRGVLTGRWGRTPQGRAFFRGLWRDDQNELVGVLKGRWNLPPGAADGTLAGRWAAFNLCDEADSLPAFDFAPGDTGGQTAGSESVADLNTYDTDATAIADELDVVLENGGLCLDRSRPYGFLRGAYRPFEPNAPVDPNVLANFDGVVRCLWRNSAGEVVGALLGRYAALAAPIESKGRAALGRFHGKYVDTQGQFIGFVRGVYGRSANGLGVFRAKYFDENENELGWLAGRWRVGAGQPGGPIFGLWNHEYAAP